MSFQDLIEYDYNFVITVVLFTTGFFYSLLTSMIFFREVRKISVFLSIGIGYYFEQLNMYVFSYYSEFNSNPQVSTVIYMVTSTIILSTLLLFKRFRSRERAIIAITSWTVIAAWFFIHFCLVVNQLVFIESKLLEVRQDTMIRYVAKNDQDGFIDFCSSKKYECLILTTKMKLIDKTKGTNKNDVSNALKTIHPLKSYAVEYNEQPYRVASGKNLFFNNSAISFITASNESHVFIVLDNKEIKDVYESIKFHVYHWYGMVISVWVCIGLIVISLHRKKFIKKEKK